MTQYKYKTSLHLTLLGEGSDHSVPIEFEYTVNRGCEATLEQPAEGPSVGLSKITLTGKDGTRYRAHDWLWELFEGDEELCALLGKSFAATYAAIKRAEFETFMEVISPWEREYLLLNV